MNVFCHLIFPAIRTSHIHVNNECIQSRNECANGYIGTVRFVLIQARTENKKDPKKKNWKKEIEKNSNTK